MSDVAGRPDGSFRIFINYRRDDARPYARLFYDAFRQRWMHEDQIFWDIDRIEAGLDFTEAINFAVGQCDVLVALIGPMWLTATDEEGNRRLDKPQDYVRLEIEAALTRGVRVIPVLVAGADMPAPNDLPPSLAPLTRRNAFSMSDTHWDYDIKDLVDTLTKIEKAKASLEDVNERKQAVQAISPLDQAEVGRQEVKPGREKPQRSPSGSRSRRRRLLTIGALAALLAAGIGTALTLTVFRGGTEAGTGMTTGRMDAIEQELLLAHVPESIRGTCKSVQTPNPEVFLRTVTCRDPTSGYVVSYSRAHNGDALRTFFLDHVAASGLGFPTAQTCVSNNEAAGEWVRDGLGGHRQQPARNAQGRVLCYTRSGRAVLEWSDTPTKIFASASTSLGDRAGLFGWWERTAGPTRQHAGGGQMHEVTGHFPDAIESELLLAHLPASVRNKCRRAAHDSYEANVFLRAVVCPQAEGSVEYSYAHSGTAMRVYFHDRVTAEGIEYPTQTTCRSGGPAADAFVAENGMKTERAARSPTGTVLCFERDGQITFEWTDIPHLIYGVASRQSNQQMALYAWWHEHAGPIVRGMTQMTG